MIRYLFLTIFLLLIPNSSLANESNSSKFPPQCNGFLKTQHTKLINVLGSYITLPKLQKNRHPDHSVTSMDFSADGKSLLSAHMIPGTPFEDGIIKLWDISNNKEIKNILAHKREITSVNFSPDNLHAVSSSYDGTIKLWNITSGEMIKILKKINAEYELAWDAKYTPNGENVLVAVNEGRKLKLLNATSGEETKTYGTELNIQNISVPATGNVFLAISTYEPPTLWHIKSGKKTKTFTRKHGFLSSLFRLKGSWLYGDISQDSNLVVVGSSAGNIRLWETRNGKELWSQKAHKEYIYQVIFSPDKSLIISTGFDNKIKLWDTQSGEQLDQIDLTSSEDYGISLAFAPDSKSFMVGTLRGAILHFEITE